MSHLLPAARAPHDTITRDRDDGRLDGRWLSLARIGWVATAVIIVGLDVIGTPALLHQLATPCAGTPCPAPQLPPAHFRQLLPLGISPTFYAAYLVALDWVSTLVFVLVATIIMLRCSTDRMALFGAFVLLTFGGAAVFGAMSALPSANLLWLLPVGLAGVIGQVLFYVFFCLFPSGRIVPHWIVWMALLEAIDQTVGTFPLPAFQSSAVSVVGLVAFVVLIAVLIGAQVYRYRRVSTHRERQQTKWVVLGLGIGLGVFIALLTYGSVTLGPGGGDDPRSTLFINTVFSVLICLVPISIGVAILRSGLWDVDVIIRRTLVYGSLTTLLVGVYFGSVLLMQHLAAALAGPQASKNPLIVVLSTLLIAALFTPLRHRIQAGIDRRFYRRKYDTARTLTDFSATLRTETDLAHLTQHLVGVVDETMQPEHISLWLRITDREVRV